MADAIEIALDDPEAALAGKTPSRTIFLHRRTRWWRGLAGYRDALPIVNRSTRDNCFFRFVPLSRETGNSAPARACPKCLCKNGLDKVEPINARSMLDAAAAVAMTATVGRPPTERRRRLSQAALTVTHQKVRKAYSPIVIAGAVRVADFVLVNLVGVALYLGYVVPISGFHWEYVAAIFGMTATAVLCFQAADIYEVQVFRGQLRQTTRMISSWAFVFLLFIGASFFAKLGGEVSRLWLAAFFFAGLAVLMAERLFLRALVRGWARDGRPIGIPSWSVGRKR